VPVLMTFPSAVTVSTVLGVTGLIEALTVDNPSSKSAEVTFTVGAESNRQTVPPGVLGAVVLPPATIFDTSSVSIVGVI
jgi:hypothetical protein